MLALALTLTLLTAAAAQEAPPSAWEQAHALGLAHVAAGRAPRPLPVCGGNPALELGEAWRRHERLLVELAGPFQPEWAGRYEVGAGMLRVAPDSGAVWLQQGCSGIEELLSAEVVAWNSDSLRVRWQRDPARGPDDFGQSPPRPVLAAEWFLVRWERERFLLSGAMLVPFCNAVNAGASLRELPGRRWEPYEDPWKRELPRGMPEVPAQWEPFLLRAPLEALLVQVGEPVEAGGDVLKVEARASLGARDGLLPGMLLHALDFGARGSAEVLAVEPLHATVELRYHKDEPLTHVPQAGWRMSTRRRGL